MVLENLKTDELESGVKCEFCGKTNDTIFFPIIFKNGSKGVVCLDCIVEQNQK